MTEAGPMIAKAGGVLDLAAVGWGSPHAFKAVGERVPDPATPG